MLAHLTKKHLLRLNSSPRQIFNQKYILDNVERSCLQEGITLVDIAAGFEGEGVSPKLPPVKLHVVGENRGSTAYANFFSLHQVTKRGMNTQGISLK